MQDAIWNTGWKQTARDMQPSQGMILVGQPSLKHKQCVSCGVVLNSEREQQFITWGNIKDRLLVQASSPLWEVKNNRINDYLRPYSTRHLGIP